jgi:hypothetical protein
MAVPARADQREADALFDRALAVARSDKAQACELFEASYNLDARAGTSINLGLCREELGQLASAWIAFKEALRRVKDPVKKQLALDRIAAIEPRLSYLTISVSDIAHAPVITLNGKRIDPGLLGTRMPVDGGRYAIEATAFGHEDWRRSIVIDAERANSIVAVPALVVTAEQQSSRPSAEESVATGSRVFTSRRKVAVTVGALGLASIGAGLAFGRAARVLERNAFVLCPDATMSCPDAEDANSYLSRARKHALFANIGYGVGGAFVVTAIVLWATGGESRSRDRVSITPYVGDASGVDVMVRF